MTGGDTIVFHVHGGLAAIDDAVRLAVPAVRVRVESNRGGGAHLFAYRVYDAGPNAGIDPVVVGILVRHVAGESTDHYGIRGDIAGEERGDVLYETSVRESIGWTALTEGVRDTAARLVRQTDTVIKALQDESRAI